MLPRLFRSCLLAAKDVIECSMNGGANPLHLNYSSTETLDIGNTFFDYDGIPPALGNLVELVEMDIAYTLFFGPIHGPEVFSNLQKLDTLQMGGNAYNQAIPAEIAQLPALSKYCVYACLLQQPCSFRFNESVLTFCPIARFYCDNSLLTGNIDFIADMPVICKYPRALQSDHVPIMCLILRLFRFTVEFWVDNNPDLGGTIPASIGDKFQSLRKYCLIYSLIHWIHSSNPF
jgi:hypothetical protein